MNGEPSLYVSIPHRYAKNLADLRAQRQEEFAFQFLIGTLKT